MLGGRYIYDFKGVYLDMKQPTQIIDKLLSSVAANFFPLGKLIERARLSPSGLCHTKRHRFEPWPHLDTFQLFISTVKLLLNHFDLTVDVTLSHLFQKQKQIYL